MANARKKTAAAKPDGLSGTSQETAPPHLDRKTAKALLQAVARLANGWDKGGDELQQAQNIMYQAWETAAKAKRIELAKKALALSPDCADAYVLLAQETSKDLDESIRLYSLGVEAGERAIGPDGFKDGEGLFWGILETRPYMRARLGLARALWHKGQYAEALTHYRGMLTLNPNDNQGVRYLLIQGLLERKLDDEARKLIKDYGEDSSADWTWSAALLEFRRTGNSDAACKALAEAMDNNPHVADYLLGTRKLPKRLPDLVGFGDQNEAIAYVHGANASWRETPGALEWVRSVKQG